MLQCILITQTKNDIKEIHFIFRIVRHSLSIYIPAPDEDSKSTLQMCGFDNGILRILEAYCKGLF